jgi:hypothetical protein
VPFQPIATQAIGLEDAGIGVRVLLFQPREQGRADVEAHVGVIVGDIADATVVVQDARSAVGRIAFPEDAFVPVVDGRRRGLQFHLIHQGVLAGRLVEMPVDAEITVVRWGRHA